MKYLNLEIEGQMALSSKVYENVDFRKSLLRTEINLGYVGASTVDGMDLHNALKQLEKKAEFQLSKYELDYTIDYGECLVTWYKVVRDNYGERIASIELVSFDFVKDTDIKVLIGCAPCQPFSTYSHKYRNNKNTIQKMDLLDYFGKQVKLVKPDIVSMENVPQLAKETVFKNFLVLLETEGVNVEFTDDSTDEIAEMAYLMNEQTENIGARRLYTILEKLLEDISFMLPDNYVEKIVIDREFVKNKFKETVKEVDVDKYIL